ncbi:SDR family NAD(P)-dependent oxidoreductase [Lentzea sp.]|uniref:SDR family NAD(P)-dependent oxidoreductase n=1 Tax=Lentzea sp. TaxID=56099 RepID=UPI002B9D336D|nr:SDR family NAD(P)-dependent oxidoreductase [Lentzea sp.]HUQ57761.1 SDR family NAD(P)-dependent oxidoreductase [Lentzea sp.]
MGRLEGRTAVITGGTAGIGLATARRFVTEGAHVLITGRRAGALDEAVAELGPSATGVRGDATDPAHLAALLAAVRERGEGWTCSSPTREAAPTPRSAGSARTRWTTCWPGT